MNLSNYDLNRYKKRLYPLRYHPVQQLIKDHTFNPYIRFTVTPSGRRSGKSEWLGKRRFVLRAAVGVDAPNPRYFVAAPTVEQAKRLYWDDLKIMTLPFRDPKRPISEQNRIIYLRRDREIHVVGMDKPERIEGSHWDGGVLDEFANMKKKTWELHVRPALSTEGRPPGWCDFVGVPEGRNHYYDLYKKAQARVIRDGSKSRWMHYHWLSSDILSPEEIAEAKEDLDELSFQQEYEGSFINFSGRAYYNFLAETHCAPLIYDPKKPISFCFDFNVEPGVCAIAQEQNYVDPKTRVPIVGKECTGIIGEVYIPRNSNTPAVCRKLVKDWKHHQSKVYIYGDATGGSRRTSSRDGSSDWDIVREELRPVFREGLVWKVPSSNPSERSRVNAVNSRLLNMNKEIRLQVDPSKAPNVVKDFEGVVTLGGGSGEIDKKADERLTHLSDGIGYMIIKKYPIKKKVEGVSRLRGF